MIGHSFANQNIILLPKNTTLRPHPLDVGIQYFKVKYRKNLDKYVLAGIQEHASATQIIKEILVAILWLKEAWRDVTNDQRLFQQIRGGYNEQMEVKEAGDLEFKVIVMTIYYKIPKEQ